MTVENNDNGILIHKKYLQEGMGDTWNVIMSFSPASWIFPAAAHNKINFVLLMEALLFNKMKA